MRVLFLGYSNTQLIDVLRNAGCIVDHLEGPIDRSADGYDLMVSFGYRHILKKEFIDSSPPILNLHISYLPFNRGAHPNYWSFVDGTPKGVTIHLIDEGIDTGPIVYQKEVEFDASEDTFSKTYARLIREIEDLFIAHLEEIVSLKFSARKQEGRGSYHFVRDLPETVTSWDLPVDMASAGF